MTWWKPLIFRGGWFSRSYNFCWKQFHYSCNFMISYNMMFKGSSEEVERWIWRRWWWRVKDKWQLRLNFFGRSEESEVGRMGMFANVQSPLPMCNVQCAMCKPHYQCAMCKPHLKPPKPHYWIPSSDLCCPCPPFPSLSIALHCPVPSAQEVQF